MHRYKKAKQAGETTKEPVLDEVMAKRIYELIQEFPAFGWRKIWALLRFREGVIVNKKKVHRIMKLKVWLMNNRTRTPRPRVKKWKSEVSESDVRWAIDMTHIDCGNDGWGHLVAVIDCHDREIIGYEFALRGRANEAQRALESACLARFGTLYPTNEGPALRSDNSLIFQARKLRESCGAHKLKQEFITPYTPQQNGMIERFFKSLKEECVWLQRFENFEQAKSEVGQWIQWYNEERPHQALEYLSPHQLRAKEVLLVA